MSVTWPPPAPVPAEPPVPGWRAYEVLGSAVHTRWSRPLAIATTTLFWAVVGMEIVYWIVVRRRLAAWRRSIANRTGSDLLVAVRLDDQYQRASNLTWGFVAIAALVLAGWTAVVLMNARDRGVPAVRVSHAASMWLVPMFGPPTAIHELARVVRAFDYSDRRLRSWLYSITALSILKPALAWYLWHTFRDMRSDTEALHALRVEVILEGIAAGLLCCGAVLATRAVLHADRAISGGRPNVH